MLQGLWHTVTLLRCKTLPHLGWSLVSAQVKCLTCVWRQENSWQLAPHLHQGKPGHAKLPWRCWWPRTSLTMAACSCTKAFSNYFHQTLYIIKSLLQTSAAVHARFPSLPCQAWWPTWAVLLEPQTSFQLTDNKKSAKASRNYLRASVLGKPQHNHCRHWTFHPRRWPRQKGFDAHNWDDEGNSHSFLPASNNPNFWV